MRRGRLVVGLIGLMLLVGLIVWAATGLPDFGHNHSTYGRIVARSSVPDRSATNSVVVTAFDYRGFDTLGEEFILFISVIGVMVLMRAVRGEHRISEEDERADRRRSSELQRWLGIAFVGPVAVLAAYVIVHGQLTPGGGFQGGVVLMTAVALIFVGGQFLVLMRLRRLSPVVEMADALGAAGFAMIGFGGLIATGAFFANFIDKGTSGLLTGGTIPLANIFVGVEVAGAFLMVLSELLDPRGLSL